MKYIILIIGLFLSVSSVAQTPSKVYIRADSTVFMKQDGNNELIILNSSRAITGGVLTNTGNGRTAFVAPSGSTNTSVGNGYKLAINNTNLLKSIRDSLYIRFDSSIANTLRAWVDTAAMFSAIRATIPSGGGAGTLVPVGSGESLKGTGDLDLKSLIAGNNTKLTATSTAITIESRDTIYILWTGQSNTSGYNQGEIDPLPNSNVQGWNTATNTWTTLTRGSFPMGTYTPGVFWSTGGFGSASDTSTGSFFYFAKRLQERTGKFIRVFNFSWGGNTISQWLQGTNFTTLAAEVAAAGSPHIDYMAWMQGEGDNSMTDTAYKARFDTLISLFDAQPWFGKDVPIFIITPTTVTSRHMYEIDMAMGSGMYDKRYIAISTKNAGLIADNVHYSAQGQYDIANTIIKTLENPSNNYVRLADSTDRVAIVTHVPNMKSGIVTQDSVTKNRSFFGTPTIVNGNNRAGMWLATTDNMVSKLASVSGSDASANAMAVGFEHYVSGNLNGRLAFFRGPSTTSDGYMSIYTNGAERMRLGTGSTGDVSLLTGRLTLDGTYTSNSAIRAGTFEMQPYAVNNAWFGDNVYYNGGFQRRSSGFVSFWYMANGGMTLSTGPNAVAGGFTPTYRAVFNNNGDVGLGGSSGGVNTITGSYLSMTSTANVFNESSADQDFRVEGDNDASLIVGDAGTDKVGIGTAAMTAKLGVLSTTEQLRLLYDASNHMATTISSTGSATLNLTGTSPTFTFSDPVLVPAGATTARVGGNLNTNVTTVGNVGTGEDNLMTYTIPAGTLATDGDRIEFEMSFVVAANSTLKVHFGATTLFTFSALATDAVYRVTGTIYRTGAATQYATFKLEGGLSVNQVGFQAPAETLSGTVVLKATGEGTSNNDITQRSMSVKFFPNN